MGSDITTSSLPTGCPCQAAQRRVARPRRHGTAGTQCSPMLRSDRMNHCRDLKQCDLVTRQARGYLVLLSAGEPGMGELAACAVRPVAAARWGWQGWRRPGPVHDRQRPCVPAPGRLKGRSGVGAWRGLSSFPASAAVPRAPTPVPPCYIPAAACRFGFPDSAPGTDRGSYRSWS